MSDQAFYATAVGIVLIGQAFLYGMCEPGDRLMYVVIMVLANIVAASVMVDHARAGRRDQ